MRSETIYIINPKNELIEHLSKTEKDVFDIFTEEVVLKDLESDRSSWRRDDYLIRAKLSFLIELYNEYCDIVEFKTLFGEGKLTLSIFDKWWLVSRLEVSREVNEVDSVDTDILPLTGNKNVDNWINTKLN